MGNIRKERRRQGTLLKTLIILSIGIAFITTTIVIMIRDGNSSSNTNTTSYNM